MGYFWAMLLTLLLSPQHVSQGLNQWLARVFIGPLVLWVCYRWARRGLGQTKSEYMEEKKSGWALLALALAVFLTFYWMTRA